MVFDAFLVELAKRKIEIFIISGNHDSSERLAFGNKLFDASGVHISPVYNGTFTKHTLTDSYGALNVYMLPFIKPTHVRKYTDAEVNSYTDAVKIAIEQMNVCPSERNILITHQFVTGAERSESEDVSVGGSDNVDASIMEGFDYVALGHLHKPQSCGKESIRYCGSALKYSFSEAKDEKSVTIVTFNAKNDVKIDTCPLIPLKDMVEIRGTYDELTARSFYEGTTYKSDYMHITLTDEQDVPDAINKLRIIYPKLMKLDYDNKRTRESGELTAIENIESKTPLELFSELYENQNNEKMTQEQSDLVQRLIEKIWEGEI
jgi:exonuclease SbcD